MPLLIINYIHANKQLRTKTEEEVNIEGEKRITKTRIQNAVGMTHTRDDKKAVLHITVEVQ